MMASLGEGAQHPASFLGGEHPYPAAASEQPPPGGGPAAAARRPPGMLLGAGPSLVPGHSEVDPSHGGPQRAASGWTVPHSTNIQRGSDRPAEGGDAGAGRGYGALGEGSLAREGGGAGAEGVALSGPPAEEDMGGANSREEGGGAASGGTGGGDVQALGGIKQRLLAHFFRRAYESGGGEPAARALLVKRFLYHFQHYLDLVMWKVQFLDRHHLLIKLGSVEGCVLRNSDSSHQNAFFAVYDTESTSILAFYQNSNEEFLSTFEHFADHFRCAPRWPVGAAYMSSPANCVHAREQLRKHKQACIASKGGSLFQAVKRTLAGLPFNCQSQSASPYFDQSLFHFDEKLISATDRHKPCIEHPIKFISRRRPNSLRFKINPGLEAGSADGRVKRVASYIFHPFLPFAISIQQSFMQPTVINLHFRHLP